MMNNFKLSKVALAIMLALGMTACSSSYQFGDLSRTYCQSTSPEFRNEIKKQLNSQGVQVGVDYCAAFGLVDAMARR